MSAWQAADTPGDATALARSFERVAQQYGPVPIWWWSGERLDRARLRWWEIFLGACVDARDLGFRFWLYDQFGFSGANFQGQLTAAHPRWAGQELMRSDAGGSVLLDLGDVRGAAEVWANGVLAATLTWSPYRADITASLRPGANDLEIIVRGTLAGYLDSASPTPAVTRGQERHGLFGPVTVMFHPRS